MPRGSLPPNLIGAPVPGGLDGESEDEAWPGQVTRDGVPEKVEGVRARLVALGANVARDVGDGLEVERVEIFITSHLVKCLRGSRGKMRVFFLSPKLCFHECTAGTVEPDALPKPMRMNDPTSMMAVCRVSV